MALTGSDVSHVTGSMLCVCATGSRAFFSYSSSTKCSTVVQVAWLPDVTKDHLTTKGAPWLRCPHAQPKVAQYAPYWGLFIGNEVIKRHMTPRGSLGMVGCVHAQPEVGNFSLLESLLTGNDVIRRHP